MDDKMVREIEAVLEQVEAKAEAMQGENHQNKRKVDHWRGDYLPPSRVGTGQKACL